MRPHFFLALLASLGLAGSGAWAQGATTPAPGEYIYEGGSGTLTIDAKRHFSIETVGTNGHTCGVEGIIRNGESRPDPEVNCTVQFTPVESERRVDVDVSDAAACRNFCGVRASFQGSYFLPTPACTRKAVAATRKSFKHQYDTKQYDTAITTLSNLLGECSVTLDWVEEAWMRNDLAVAFYRAGRPKDCLKILAPLTEDANTPDDELAYPPVDKEVALPFIRATRTNLKLCGAK